MESAWLVTLKMRRKDYVARWSGRFNNNNSNNNNDSNNDSVVGCFRRCWSPTKVPPALFRYAFDSLSTSPETEMTSR